MRGRLEIQYEDIGDQNLKNINSPVRAYRISLSGSAPKPHDKVVRLPSRLFRTRTLEAVAGLIVALGLGATWRGWNSSSLLEPVLIMQTGIHGQKTTSAKGS